MHEVMGPYNCNSLGCLEYAKWCNCDEQRVQRSNSSRIFCDECRETWELERLAQ